MDREEFAALVGAVKEIATAVRRIEDRLDQIEGRMTRMEERMDRMEERMDRMEERQTRMESDLREFRRESKNGLAKISRRMDHHDIMLMDHNRRLREVEAAIIDAKE